MSIFNKAILAVTCLVFSFEVYAHCAWNHPGHCVTEPDLSEPPPPPEPPQVTIPEQNIVHIEVGEVDIEEEIIDTINHYGSQFETAMCRLVGKEPGKDCSVGGGGSCETNGDDVDCSATDSQGNPVPEKPQDQEPTIEEILAWNKDIKMTEIDQQFFSERFMVGSLVVFMKGPLENASGVTWMPEIPGAPTKSGILRPPEHGRGLVGARRARGDSFGLHRGTDYQTAPGDEVIAPTEGKIQYSKLTGTKFDKVVITSSSGHQAMTLYVQKGNFKNGDTVKRGSVIGTAQNLHKPGGYPKTVPQHVHVEHVSPEGHSLAPNNDYAIVNRETEGLEKWAERCSKTKCYDNFKDASN